MDQFEIRKVTDADVDALVRLYDDVWPRSVAVHQQKAHFVLRESLGVSYCATRDGQIVGSRTSFFMPVYYGKRALKCVQFADSCIHESCRRQGLFLKMNTAFLHGFFNENGGELVYNISVDASRKAYEKLGWVYIQSLSAFVKYARPFHILKRVHLDIRKIHGSIIENLNTELAEIDDKLLVIRENKLREKDLIHVNYNAELIRWRLKSGNGIKVFNDSKLGCIIYKEGVKECGIKVVTIGDIFLYNYSIENLKKIEKEFQKKKKADMIICYFSLSHPLYKMMKRNHYLGGKRFVNQGVKVVTDEMRQICLNPENWAISFLDIDTF